MTCSVTSLSRFTKILHHWGNTGIFWWWCPIMSQKSSLNITWTVPFSLLPLWQSNVWCFHIFGAHAINCATSSEWSGWLNHGNCMECSTSGYTVHVIVMHQHSMLDPCHLHPCQCLTGFPLGQVFGADRKEVRSVLPWGYSTAKRPEEVKAALDWRMKLSKVGMNKDRSKMLAAFWFLSFSLPLYGNHQMLLFYNREEFWGLFPLLVIFFLLMHDNWDACTLHSEIYSVFSS